MTETDNLRLYFPPERPRVWPSDYFAAARQPLRTVPQWWRREARYAAAVFLAAFLLYALTAPRFIAAGEDSLFAGALHTWGVARPPGHSTYSLLGGIFYHLLPFGSPAYKAHLFSAAAAAAACVALYAVVCQLIAGRLFAVIAALSFAVSKGLWSQAIVANAHALNAFLFFCALALAVALVSDLTKRGQLRRLLVAFAVVYGMGLANHPFLFLLASPVFFMLLIPRFHNLAAWGVGIGVVLATYILLHLWMVARSENETAFAYSGPIEKFTALFSSLPAVDGGDAWGEGRWLGGWVLLRSFVSDLFWQFTPLGCLFAFAGFFVMARSRYGWLWLSLFASFLALVGGALWVFDLGDTPIDRFSVYLIPGYGLMALWLAVGCAWTADRLSGFPIPWRRGLAAVIACFLVGGSLAAHWSHNQRSDYRWAHDLAMAKLEEVKEDAVLFLHDEPDAVVGFLHYVEGVRPDLLVYHDRGLIYPNRLFSPWLPPYPPPEQLQTPSQAAYVQNFVHNDERPLYYHADRRHLFAFAELGSRLHGFSRSVYREGSGERLELSESAMKWLGENVRRERALKDPQSRVEHERTVMDLIGIVEQFAAGGYRPHRGWREAIEVARQRNLKIRIFTSLVRLERMSREEREREIALLNDYDIRRDAGLSPEDRGQFYLLKARLIAALDEDEETLYLENLRRAVDENPSFGNQGLIDLFTYYDTREAYHCDLLALVERFYPDVNDMPEGLLKRVREVRKTALRC